LAENNYDQPIDAGTLRKAMAGLEPLLGTGSMKNIIEGLKRQNIDVSSDINQYSIHQVRAAFVVMFSSETADLLIGIIEKAL
jgi:hypothetical protein